LDFGFHRQQRQHQRHQLSPLPLLKTGGFDSPASYYKCYCYSPSYHLPWCQQQLMLMSDVLELYLDRLH
jgi:hypothetical protein